MVRIKKRRWAHDLSIRSTVVTEAYFGTASTATVLPLHDSYGIRILHNVKRACLM